MDFIEIARKYNIDISNSELEKFESYFSFLVEYNSHTNLTAITEHDEVFYKHFLDSILLNKAIDLNNKTLCDVGAGAGFPSVPCAIINSSVSVDIIDSLNKRIIFLNELIEKLDLKNVSAYHNRAEDRAKDKRESYDVVSARAVARLSLLSELCLPLTKVGGYFVAMKSMQYEEELNEARNAIKVLGGEVVDIKKFSLPNDLGERYFIIIKKIKESPKKYPRQFAQMKKSPIK